MARLPASLWPLHRDLQPPSPLEPQGVWFSIFQALTGLSGVYGTVQSTPPPHQGPPLGGRRKRGATPQAIGRSRGGRTTKVHALTDDAGRPRVLLLTPGNIS
jgi:hypothetical protein